MALLQTYEKKNQFKDFDLSFSLNPITGDLGTKTDANAINQSLKNLVNTNFSERPFQPLLGCNIRALLFELADPITKNDLKINIQQVISNYEPRIAIQELRVDDLSDQNAYNIRIVYRILKSNTINTFDTILKRLR